MGRPKYKFIIVATEGEPYIYQEMVPEPPPTPEKFQRKARIRRVNQAFFQHRLTEIRWAAAREQIERDYWFSCSASLPC
jgi:hypothetical protein